MSKFTFLYPINFVFNPDFINSSGVGGADLTLIEITEALSRKGHEVEVYVNHDRTGTFNNVIWKQLKDLFPDTSRDILIYYRLVYPATAGISARLKIFWTVDPFNHYDWVRRKLPLIMSKVDGFWVISEYHKKQIQPLQESNIQLAKNHNNETKYFYNSIPNKTIKYFFLKLFPSFKRFVQNPEYYSAVTQSIKKKDMIFITNLGINPNEYKDKIPKIPGRLIYCSMPDRGLKYLTTIFPKILDKIPDATLVITGDFTLWGKQKGNEGYKEAFSKMKNVIFHGKISRPEMIKEQKQAEIHIYPCIMEENFCISSIECQAAGTPTISSSWGALPTTVKDGYSGIIISGHPESESFQKQMTDTIVDLLTHRDKLKTLQTNARKRAFSQFTWDIIAGEWEKEINSLLSQKGKNKM